MHLLCGFVDLPWRWLLRNDCGTWQSSATEEYTYGSEIKGYFQRRAQLTLYESVKTRKNVSLKFKIVLYKIFWTEMKNPDFKIVRKPLFSKVGNFLNSNPMTCEHNRGINCEKIIPAFKFIASKLVKFQNKFRQTCFTTEKKKKRNIVKF